MNSTDKFLDLKELSEYSALGVSTLRDYIKRSDLPAFKLNGKILIRQSEFHCWLEKYRYNSQDLNALADDIINSLA